MIDLDERYSESEADSDPALYGDYWPELFEDEEVEEIERQRQLNRIRSKRLNNQKGKYIIVGNAYNCSIYLQDRRISKNGYWTKYKANARTFNTKEEAEKVVAYFKYNEPKVVKV